MQLEVVRIPISDLIPDPNNARKHDKKNLDAIKGSLAKFGQVEPLVVNKRTGIVVGGNGRLEAMKVLGYTDVAITYVDLDNTQATALGLALNRTGELASWEDETLGRLLQSIREDGFELADIGFDIGDLEDFGIATEGGDGSGTDDENIYTKKIESPIYTPKGDKPKLEELYDSAKSQELSKEIDSADIPADIKGFLHSAAKRHVVFHYDRIAEYYAHAPKEVQELMENSALVIIDFNKAIENGFVVLTKEIAEAYFDGE